MKFPTSTRTALALAFVGAGFAVACSLITPVDDLLAKDGGVVGDAASEGAPPPTDGGTPDVVLQDVQTIDSGPDAGCGTLGPTTGLLGYWPMDEGQGSIVHDCTSNHFDGTFVAVPDGGTLWTPGRVGSAIRMNDVNEGCVDLGLPMALRNLAPFSVSAWIRPDAYPSTGSNWYVVGRTLNPATSGWRIALGDFSFVEFRGASVNGPLDLGADGGPVSSWTHVGLVFRPGVATELYMGGALAQTKATAVMAFTDDTAHVRIGCRGDGTAGISFKGLIDEVRIYGVALTAGDIATLAK